MASIACAHPGKLGDALYCLPAIRELCERHGSRADFYTSRYCAPMRRLFEAQDCIERFIIAPGYVLRDFACGGQPWQITVPTGYEAVYQMGFPDVPTVALPDYIAGRCGLPPGLPIHYDIDLDLPTPDLDEPYIVSAPRGRTAYAPMFRAIADTCPIKVVEIGATGEGSGSPRALDKTGLDMLEVLPWIESSRGFVGLHSAMLVLANGFPIPKVAPKGTWDMRHVVCSVYNEYLAEPSAAEVLRRLGVETTYCRTLNPADYDWIHETRHAENIKKIVGTYGGRAEHPRRAWEYGIVLHALREHGCKTVLDVGGGGSAFAPAAAWVDMTVTELDPEDYRKWVREQARKIAKPISYEHCDFMAYEGPTFDAVTCISVLEHVPDDEAFFRKLASHVRVGGLLGITVDFWPDAQRKSRDHLRTYNAERLLEFVDSVPGFVTLGSPEYSHLGKYVYDYTFASLVCRRIA